ncbi:MAG: glycoside hydrolase, partial [Spirochaetales bacterium]|nr:glycoside hydrolase [Spirochaetales bacterium]
MKRTLGCLKEIDRKGGDFTFRFENGSLTVSFISREIILFDYNALGYKVPSMLKDARDYIFIRPDSCLDVSMEELEDDVVLHSDNVELRLDKVNGNVSVFRNGILVHGGRAGGKDTVIPQTQFSLLGNSSEKIGRFVFAREMEDSFYGLGDKGGSPERTGRRVRMYNKDALGYDAENSDPLYKSIPFLLKVNRAKGVAVGLYFPDPCIRSFDICSESRFYFSAEVVDGPFSYAVMMGDDYRQVLTGYCSLSGRPAFPPLYSFGYFGSSMNYAEAWDAQQRIERFFRDVEDRDLPCEGLYVSSGYLKADDGKRYSFFWNRRKFPDPKAFLDDLRRRGYHLTFNIKPGILKTHPWYGELVEKGYLLKDNAGRPIVEYFWGGDASFIDFNNPDAIRWWKGKLNEAYLDFGVEGVWNDNNECELADGELDAYKVRSVYPVRMA